MVRPATHAPRRSGSTHRLRSALARSLPLAAALLLWSPAAWAAGGVTFTNMTVERCGELGACEWRLSCWLGKGSPMQLVGSAEGAAKAAIDIGRSVPVDRFPATVSCTAWEDDGWPGASWDPVASGSVLLPSGGDFALELANADEGIVRVHMVADSLEVVGAPPAGSPRRFLGAFRAAPNGHAVIVGLPWEALAARAKALAGRGVHLYDLETYRDGDKRLWSGIFRSGPDEQTLIGGLEWDPFVARYKELTEGGNMRLVDLETYDDGKKRLFAGVFHTGDDLNALWVGQEQNAFLNKWTELTGQGLRLTDLEVYRADRKLYYAGVFREGSGGRGFWPSLDWDGFVAKAKTSSDDGMQVVDLESFEDGKKRMYAASLKGGGTPVEIAPAQDWTAFAAKWNEERGKGVRLIDLETYPE